jgi:Helix-turn-helix domain
MMRSRSPALRYGSGYAVRQSCGRCRVPIGETLAEARQRAGLTVAQVSQQTCIDKAVIVAIEGGDYSACGAGVDARANIRSIAWVVGADPRPLIAEYDALHLARGASPTVGLEELLASPGPAPQRRRPRPSVAGGVVAAGSGPVPAYRPRGRWLYWAVVVGLVAVLGFGVYSHLSGQQHAALGPAAAGKRAVTHRQAGHSGPSPVPTATRAAAAPAPAPTITHAGTAAAPAAAVPAQTLTPASAATPAGAAAPGPGDTPPPAPRATGGDHPAGGNPSPGPAHRLAHHRPVPKPRPSRGPAPRQATPGHGRPGHHRPRGPAAQQAAGTSVKHLPGRRHHVRPGRRR